MCIRHFFLASERRSTVDVRRRPGYKIWRLFKFSSILLSFKTRHWLYILIYINFAIFKLEKAPNFVTRPASTVERRSEVRKKCGMHISVKCVVNTFIYLFVCHSYKAGKRGGGQGGQNTRSAQSGPEISVKCSYCLLSLYVCPKWNTPTCTLSADRRHRL
jgi:hypothetical protein